MFDNLCLFAHFDRDDLLADYVVHYLEAIRSTGFEIVVISTSRLSKDDVLRLKAIAHDVILRENEGHDFASWALGIERYADRVAGKLLIANDSVYAPVGDLRQALNRLFSEQADVYGMIESREIARHLQSWFIIFEPHVHKSSAFRTVFAQKFHGISKFEIIKRGEVGLSQALLACGYTLRGLFDGNLKNGRRLNISSNYSHFLWRELIEQEGIPFLKIELLRVNPCKIAELHEWREVVSARCPNLVPMIQDHLHRTCKSGQADIAQLHRLETQFNDRQSVIRRDYAYAASRRLCASKLNLVRMLLHGKVSGFRNRLHRLSVAPLQRIRAIQQLLRQSKKANHSGKHGD